MQKDILTEMIDELTELQNEQKKITLSVPASPKDVLAAIDRVLRRHKLSSEDALNGMAIRTAIGGLENVSLDELKLAGELHAHTEEEE